VEVYHAVSQRHQERCYVVKVTALAGRHETIRPWHHPAAARPVAYPNAVRPDLDPCTIHAP
jgi:hypothetical protein